MGTIVQEYGPIYGEAVNGTVSGRPNGSVYVPTSNTIEISIAAGAKIYQSAGTILSVTSALFVNAIAQDLASNVVFSVFEDAECTTQFGTSRSLTAGIFNSSYANISFNSTAPTSETSYYIRAQLLNNGTPVATSNVLEVVGQ